MVNIFGGKITIYRKLAEDVMEYVEAALGARGKPWTADAPLPGGDFPAISFEVQVSGLRRDYPFLNAAHAHRLVRQYGTRARMILGEANSLADLGEHFGVDLYAAEIRFLMEQEWAMYADDVLWRRTKRGLRLTKKEAERLDLWMHAQAGNRTRSISG